MTLLKTAFLDMTRRKMKSIILFLVLILIFCGVFSSITLYYSAQDSLSTALSEIGSTVSLSCIDENYILSEKVSIEKLISNLSSIEHVIGINQHLSDYATPVDFSNCKLFDGENPYTQEIYMQEDEETENYVVLDGNTRIDLLDIFRTGKANLIDGEFPTNDFPGALLSQQIAEENNLAVGDKISVRCMDDTFEFTVVGVYETYETFTITSDNIVGPAVFSFSPYNRIYIDIDSFADVYCINKDALSIDIYIDSPDYIR